MDQVSDLAFLRRFCDVVILPGAGFFMPLEVSSLLESGMTVRTWEGAEPHVNCVNMAAVRLDVNDCLDGNQMH